MSLRTSYTTVMGLILPFRRDPDPTVRTLANSAHFAARSVWGHLSSGREVPAANMRTAQDAFYRLWNHLRRTRSPEKARRLSDATNAFIREAALRNRRLRRSRARRRRVRRLVRRPAMRGFGQVEEIIEEIVETVTPAPATGLRLALGVGAVALVGFGLYYGMTTKSYTGRRVYRGST